MRRSGGEEARSTQLAAGGYRERRRLPCNSLLTLCWLLAMVSVGLGYGAEDDRVPAPVRETVTIDATEREYDVWLPTEFHQDETYWLMIATLGPIDRYWPLLKQAKLRAILVRPSFQMRPRGYMAFPSLGEGAVLLKMIEDLRATYRLHSKILLTGFSGGANFAHRFAFQHPEVVLACAPYAAGSWSTADERFLVKGLGEVRDARTFANGNPIPEKRRTNREHYLNDWAMKAGKQRPLVGASNVPFLVMCGTQDTERLQNAKDFAESLKAAGFRVETAWPEAGHRLTIDVQSRVVKFFKKVIEEQRP